MEASPSPLTRLLHAAREGDASALDAAFAHVYDELHRLASRVRRGRAGATLNTTALVHEAYAKLAVGRPVAWNDRVHFYRVAARAMRQVLVDEARRQQTHKRNNLAVTLDEAAQVAPLRPDDLLALDDALTKLARLDARLADVVQYRFFVGLTIDETAQILGVSAPTVQRDWRTARAWLRHVLGG